MKIRCKKCDVVFQGEPDDMNVIACTSCGYRMRVRAKEGDGGGDDSAEKKTPTTRQKTPSATVPSRTPSGAAPAGGPRLPTTMRANKLIAGKTCPGCNETIALGQEVHNCESCGKPTHESCWSAKGACPDPACAGAIALAKDQGGDGSGDGEGGSDDEKKPCKFCGETIKAGARKCRFCGEYQNARDRAAQDRKQTTSATDDEMQPIDWVLCLLCGTIGCIVGIVYAIQGKKKGGKMIAISILVQVLLRILITAIAVSAR